MTTRTLPTAFARFRCLRSSEPMRSLVRETRLSPEGFVYPLFVSHGEGLREEGPVAAVVEHAKEGKWDLHMSK